MDYNAQLSNWIRYSVTFRIVTIGILALLLLIPLNMVSGITYGRKNMQDVAFADISQKWGAAQTVAGPILSIPYTTYVFDEKGQRTELIKYAHFLPDTLHLEASVDPEIRSRGIFDAVVYTSDILFSGSFSAVNVSALGLSDAQMDWGHAFVSIGISDTRGIDKSVMLRWNDEEIFFTPGVKTDDVVRNTFHQNNYDMKPYVGMKNSMVFKEMQTNTTQASGLSALLPGAFGNAQERHNFSFDLKLNGSQHLQFVPLGRTTDISLASSWEAPSFSGAFLPDTRDISEDGFSATWNILDLNRNYPQAWVGNTYDVYSSASGVTLLAGVDGYDKTARSVKYAILIIALTFMVFFFVEMFGKRKIHPIQYILVGLAIVLFYTLLLSLSEIWNFGAAYLISSIAIIGLISLYAKSVLQNKKSIYIQTLILAFLYLFVYVILQLEDYALLIGSLLLFVILATVMYITRKVDWYVAGNMPLEDLHKK